MPISEDEYDPCSGVVVNYEPTSTMSKAELRKTHKPIMEKRRRARINHCLNEIKSLILDAMKKDPARHSKLEKADILEMAVKHLQDVQRQQLAVAMASDPSVLRKFKAGFNECAEEVKRYVGSLEGLDAAVQQRISSHLSKCISGIEQLVHLTFPGFGGVPFLATAPGGGIFSSTSSKHGENSASASSDDHNNNPSLQLPRGFQLIPSRLPTGEIALLLPNSSNLSYFSSLPSPNNQPAGPPAKTTSTQEKRHSAFVAVVPSSSSSLTSPRSPPQSPTSSRRTPSPHGFRPVNSQHSRPIFGNTPSSIVTSSTPHESSSSSSDPQISNTSIQPEVKNMRFPIQKLAEPLSIITNQSERYKHARTPEESVLCEENLMQRGIKRKLEGVAGQSSGLLSIASPKSKIVKLAYHESAGGSGMGTQASFAKSETNRTFYGAEGGSSSTSGIGADSQKNVFVKYGSNYATSSSQVNKEREQEESKDMWRPW